MIKYKLGKNSIIIGDGGKVFDNSIKKVFEFNNILIVLTNFDNKSMDNEPNVFGFASDGTELWEIEILKDSSNKYINIKEEKGRVVVYDVDHFKYVINEKCGDIEKKKIMPLKDIDDDNPLLFTMTNFYQLLGLIGVLLILIFILRASIKVHNENVYSPNSDKNIEENNFVEEYLENNEEVNIDNLVQDAINEELERNNEDIFEYVSKSLIEESPKETPGQNTPSSSNTQSTTSSNEDDTKYEGINLFVDIVDKIFGAIKTGKPTTIEDTNSKATNGCTYIETFSDARIKVYLNGEEVILKLISINELESTAEHLHAYLSSQNTLYIEQDTKKHDDDGNLLVYLYTKEGNSLDDMVNFYLLHNGYAMFEIQPPNIKYNYLLQY